MSGEATHAKGADGARRAKAWLEATTRVNVHWVNPDPVAVEKLTFSWADGSRAPSILEGSSSGTSWRASCSSPSPRNMRSQMIKVWRTSST